MEKKYDIVTAMDVCVDILLQTAGGLPEFGQKEKLIRDYEVELGGSCSIFACQASKLGLKTAGIGVVGRDIFGRMFIDKLSDAGVYLDYVKTDENVKTSVGVAICRDDGDRAILTYTGTIDAVCPEYITKDILKNTRHLHVGSYFLMKKLTTDYKVILNFAKKQRVTVSLDTNWDLDEKWDSGIWDILPYVDIFLPNENEVKFITRKNTLQEAIDTLSKIILVIAVKQGKYGATAYAEGKIYKAFPIDVRVVDTVGAGDSFDAGFIYGYLKGYSIHECLEIGSICGSYNTSQVGGIKGQPKLNDMLKSLYSSNVSRLKLV